MIICLIIFNLLAITTASATTVIRKLNGPSVLGDDVTTYQISPDGHWVVYEADQDEDDLFELYSVSLDGGAPIKLSGPMLQWSRGVWDFTISQDSRYVVYRANQDISFKSDLYSVPIEGGEIIKLSSALNGRLDDLYQISPDSAWIVCAVDNGGSFRLYSVSILGGSAVELGQQVRSDGQGRVFEISPDGSRVVFLSSVDSPPTVQLYSIPIGGGAPVKLNATLVNGGNVSEFLINAASNRVVYRADQDMAEVDELYSVSIEGGSPDKLNIPLENSGDVWDFQLSPDGQAVVYRMSQSAETPVAIYHVAVIGGPSTRLNSPIELDGALSVYEFSPDSQSVVYIAAQGFDRIYELFSVSLINFQPIQLNKPLETQERVLSFQISPDSYHVVYRTFRFLTDEEQLFSVPLHGGPSVPLTRPLINEFSQVTDFQISVDSWIVIYRNNVEETRGTVELYRVPIEGGDTMVLNGPLPVGGNVLDFQLGQEGYWSIYRADQDVDGIDDLYSVPVQGGSPIKLSQPQAIAGDVVNFRVSWDHAQVVYQADLDRDDVFQLYSVPTVGGPSVRLSAGEADEYTGRYQISPDGHYVVFDLEKFFDDFPQPYKLYSVPLTGGSPVKLAPHAPELAYGGDHQISPDSAWVIYRTINETGSPVKTELFRRSMTGGEILRLDTLADDGYRVDNDFSFSPNGEWVVSSVQTPAGMLDLYSIPMNSGPPIKLNNLPTNGGGVHQFAISSDSSRVVYLADQEVPQVVELYSVSITGGVSVKLNGLLVGGGDVRRGDWAISPDASRVVYIADQDTDNVLELYSVPIGGGSAVKLSVVSVSSAKDFEISLNSSQVVYKGWQSPNLYSVPLAGGDSVQLNSDEMSTRRSRWTDFSISPDSNWVVYWGEQIQNEDPSKLELLSVALTGGEMVKLNGPIPEHLTGVDFQISADSQQVVYRVGRYDDEGPAYEISLYRAPIRGEVVTLLWSPLSPYGQIRQFEISADGLEVIHVADQNQFSVFELFDHYSTAPNLTLTAAVASPQSILPGQSLTYTLTVANIGTEPATGVVLTETLPLRFTLESITTSLVMTPIATSPNPVWQIEDLAPGQTDQLLLTGVLDMGIPAGTSLTNTAVIASAGEEANPGNNRGSVMVVVENGGPIAQDDFAVTEQSKSVTLYLLANDVDPNGDMLSLNQLQQPAQGSVQLNADQSITYTPTSGFIGMDAFSYSVGDSGGLSDTAQVTVTVTADNAPPAWELYLPIVAR